MSIKMKTTVILESEPINIPNVKKCRANHGLVTAVRRKDMTFGVFTCKARLKSLEKKRRGIEEENRKELKKRNREIEKAISGNKYKDDD